jgi:hypothetical protein
MSGSHKRGSSPAREALPPPMRTLFDLASAPNATPEGRAAAAVSIVHDTPLPALTRFVLAVIQQAAQEARTNV